MLLLSTMFFHFNNAEPDFSLRPPQSNSVVQSEHMFIQRYRLKPLSQQRLGTLQASMPVNVTPTVTNQGLGTPTGSSGWVNTSRGLVSTSGPRKLSAPGNSRR